MKNVQKALSTAVVLTMAQAANAQIQGPSTGTTPYVLPTVPGMETISVLTVDNTGVAADDTVPNLVGGAPYGMAGIPDGMGAFDNGNGTFTLVVNHEIGNTLGVSRAHGSIGSYVSKWIINKSNLSVAGGTDLMKSIYGWNSMTQQSNTTPATFAFNRFCSADLPEVSAFYNANSGLGTQERIFMHGEEGGVTGYQLGSVVTGPDAGNSYVLGKFNLGTGTDTFVSGGSLNVTSSSTSTNLVTYTGTAAANLGVGSKLLGQLVTAIDTSKKEITLAGNANADIAASTSTPYLIAVVGAWENALACPFPQDTTIVIGNNDGGTGIMNNSVSVYVGTKQSTGTEVDKAGLTNGVLKFIAVTGFADSDGATTEEFTNGTTHAKVIPNGTRFTLSATTSTGFSRPEDGAWNPLNPREYYFNTTDRLDQVSDGTGSQIGQTRVWRLTFDDLANPNAGGKIECMIDGQMVAGVKVNMFDNMTVNKKTGRLLLQEDVGAAAHNGKMYEFDPATFTGASNSGTLVKIATHDTARFGEVGVAATLPYNNDEETSGVIDITDIMTGSALHKGNPGEAWYISSDQAHYTTNITTAQVEGGQMFVIHQLGAQLTRGGYARDRRTGLYSQLVTLQNGQQFPVSGPFNVALDSLTFGVTLANGTGTTANNAPLGSPFLLMPASSGGVAAGASLSATFQFSDPSNTAINYTPRVLSGPTAP